MRSLDKLGKNRKHLKRLLVFETTWRTYNFWYSRQLGDLLLVFWRYWREFMS